MNYNLLHGWILLELSQKRTNPFHELIGVRGRGGTTEGRGWPPSGLVWSALCHRAISAISSGDKRRESLLSQYGSWPFNSPSVCVTLTRESWHARYSDTHVHVHTRAQQRGMQTGSVAETGSPLMTVCRGTGVGVTWGESRTSPHVSCCFAVHVEKSDPCRISLCFLPPCWTLCEPSVLFVIQLRCLAFWEFRFVPCCCQRWQNLCRLSCLIWLVSIVPDEKEVDFFVFFALVSFKVTRSVLFSSVNGA